MAEFVIFYLAVIVLVAVMAVIGVPPMIVLVIGLLFISGGTYLIRKAKDNGNKYG